MFIYKMAFTPDMDVKLLPLCVVEQDNSKKVEDKF